MHCCTRRNNEKWKLEAKAKEMNDNAVNQKMITVMQNYFSFDETRMGRVTMDYVNKPLASGVLEKLGIRW